VTSHAELLAQRRQERAITGELALGAQHVGPRDTARLVGDAYQLQVVLVGRHDVLGRLDLGQRRGDRDRLRGDRRGERHVGARQLVELALRQRPLLLDEASITPEHVGRVGEHGASSSSRTRRSRPVVVARNQGNDAIIAKGLEAGEQVVTDGQPRLVQGSAVEVRQPPRAR
jgi:multidrug efflux pump subunit AcrA (membrane-fusion protein)